MASVARDTGAGGPGKKEGFGFHLSLAQWKDSKPAELGTALANAHVAGDGQNQDRRVVSTSLEPPLRKAEGSLALSRHNCLAPHTYPGVHPLEGRVAVMGGWQLIDISCFKNKVLGSALTLT